MAPFILAARKKLTENAHKSKPSSLPVEPPARLGFGEYHFPAHFNKAALYAQLEFIQKIEDLAQEVLVNLAESVRPAYERLRIEIGDAELLSLNAETLRNLAKHGRNDFGSLLERLEDWIDRYHLDAEWVRNMALRTLFHWTGKFMAVPGGRLQFSAPISATSPIMPEDFPFSFSDSGWMITNESRKVFVERVTAQFNIRLAGYLKGVETRAEETGWKKTPKLRRFGKNSDPFRHFGWLVRWQCQDWTTAEIAKEYGLGKSAKRKMVNKSTEIADSSTRPSERSKYAADKDQRRQAAYQAVYAGLRKTAKLLDLPLRLGKEGMKNNLSR